MHNKCHLTGINVLGLQKKNTEMLKKKLLFFFFLIFMMKSTLWPLRDTTKQWEVYSAEAEHLKLCDAQ